MIEYEDKCMRYYLFFDIINFTFTLVAIYMIKNYKEACSSLFSTKGNSIA